MLNFEMVELFHVETLISRRITEHEDFKRNFPHMAHVADEQIVIYNRMHTKVLNEINDRMVARSA